MRKLILLALLSLASCACRAQIPTDPFLTKWVLHQKIDKMTGNLVELVMKESEYQQEFRTRHQALSMGIKRVAGVINMMFILDNQEFDDVPDKTLDFRFDDDPMQTFNFWFPVHGDSSMIDVRDAAYLLGRLRKAHTMLVRVTLNRESQRTFEFDVRNIPL